MQDPSSESVRARANAILTIAPRRRWSAFLLAMGFGCSNLVLPTPPVVEDLLTVYSVPDADLRPADLGNVVAEAMARREDALKLDRLVLVETTLDASTSKLATYAGSSGSALSVNATFSAKTACPEEGDLDYKAVLEQSILRKTIWGSLRGCAVAPERTLSGVFSASLAQDTPISKWLEKGFERGPILFRVDGTLQDPGPKVLEFDFRILDAEQFEVRIPRSDGSLIARFSQASPDFLIRARNGSYCCDEALRSCAPVVEPSCASERSSGQEIPW